MCDLSAAGRPGRFFMRQPPGIVHPRSRLQALLSTLILVHQLIYCHRSTSLPAIRYLSENPLVNLQLAKPLSFAIALALSGAAFAAPPPSSKLDPASLDRKVDPCADFYTFVDGKWIAANPVPADRTRWGTFDELREASLKAQRSLIENAANAKPAAGTIEQKLGDFYATGMDEAAIEKTGMAPLEPELAKIAALKSANDLTAYLIESHARGIGQVFNFSAYPDFKNSSMVIGYAGEDGLGLPERAYYLEDKPDYVKIRGDYVAHIEKTLALAGVKADEAKQNATWILAFETQIAKASLSPTEG